MRKEDVSHTINHLHIMGYFKNQHVLCVTPENVATLNRLKEKYNWEVNKIQEDLLDWKPKDYSKQKIKEKHA